MKKLLALAARYAEQDAQENPGDPMQSASEGAQRALWAAATDSGVVAELTVAVLNRGRS